MLNKPEFLLKAYCNLTNKHFTKMPDGSIDLHYNLDATKEIVKNGKLLINFIY